MAPETRLRLLRVLAVLLAFRGAGNVLKRLGTGSGLVAFGHLLPPESLWAPLLGMAMIAYAWGLWTVRAWSVPVGVAYALFVTANLLLFPVVTGLPARITMPMYAAYGAVGLALCWGAAWLARVEVGAGRAGASPT